LERSWTAFEELPKAKISKAWIVDVDAAMGGGPLAPFAVGIYSTGQISAEMQTAISEATGWDTLPSTQAYIERYYAKFSDPMQAYVDDMVTHELGHLFFGFGLTTHSSPELYQAWFPLGLGILYDRLAWNRLYQQHESPMFQGLIDAYLQKYKDIAELDQRLVSPDLSQDKHFRLSRAQIYGHGKAFIYLSALRESLNAAEFDASISRYLSREAGAWIEYDDFVETLSLESKRKISKLEQDFVVR